MLKRVAITALVGAALFGAVSAGMLAHHRQLRRSAVELLRLDFAILVGN